ncbi:MAG: hypothetical protein P8009_04065 [Gammaproteobacteria bacterium]
MTREAEVRDFVRRTLGCSCPEHVFDRIEDAECTARPGMPGYRRLVIGDRLLIYLVTPVEEEAAVGAAPPAGIAAQLPVVLASGRAERDRLGLNRFRAVVPSTDPPRLEPVLREVFETFRDQVGDDKLHLHVVARGACPPSPGAGDDRRG